MQLGPVALDLGLGYVDVAHGQGIRKGIEEGRRIIRLDVHDRICRRLVIVEGNLHRIEQAGEGAPLFVQSFDEPAVDVLACLVEPTGIQQLNDLPDRLSEGIVLWWGKACTVYRMYQKDINDFLTTEAGPAFKPAGRRRGFPARRWGGRGSHKGIDPSFFDIESKGREHTADGGEFREVIIGDDADFRSSPPFSLHRYFAGMVWCEAAGKLNMVRDGVRLEPFEVLGVHPRHKILKDLIIDVRTEGGQGLDDRLVKSRPILHGPKYSRSGVRCASAEVPV